MNTSKASIDLRMEISQRKALSLRQRPRTSPAIRPTSSKSKDHTKTPLVIAGSNQPWVLDREEHDLKNPSHLLAQEPSLDKELLIASTYSQYLQDPESALFRPQPSQESLPPMIQKPTKVAQLCEKVEMKKFRPKKRGSGGSRISWSQSQSMFSGSTLDQNSSILTGDPNIVIEEKSDIIQPTPGATLLEEEGGDNNAAIGIADQPVETTEETQDIPIQLSAKDRLFYDMWITSHHDNVEEIDPLNLDLLCQLQTSLTRLDLHHSSVLADEHQKHSHEFPSSSSANTGHHHQQHNHHSQNQDELEDGVDPATFIFDPENMEGWSSEKIQYIKSITSIALGTFDLLVQEAGKKYPILADMRDAILPIVFHSKPNHILEEEIENLQQHAQDDLSVQSKEETLKQHADKYQKYYTFIEKWHEAFQNCKYMEATRSNLEHQYEAMKQANKHQAQQIQMQQFQINHLETAHESLAKEAHQFEVSLHKKDEELKDLQERFDRELHTYQEVLQKLQTLTKEKEKVNFAILEGEFKVKELDAKVLDYSSQIEKLKKEINDLKKERRDMKSENKELSEQNNRQSTIIQSERQKTSDLANQLQETLQKYFTDFVDFSVIENAQNKTEGSVLVDKEENATKHRHALYVIHRVNEQRQQLQQQFAELTKKNQQTTQDYERYKITMQDHVQEMQQQHKQEVDNLNKSAHAVQDTLRKAGLRKEVEKAALNSMLHTTKEELKVTKEKLKQTEEELKRQVERFTEENTMLLNQRDMLQSDTHAWTRYQQLFEHSETQKEHIHELKQEIEKQKTIIAGTIINKYLYFMSKFASSYRC